MSLPSTRRTWAINLLSQRMKFKSTTREKRLVVVRRSQTTTGIEITKRTTMMVVPKTVATDAVAEVETGTTKERDNNKMVVTLTEVASQMIRGKDLKLAKMVISHKEIETEVLATTRITKMVVTTSKPIEVQTVETEVVIKEPTTTVIDPEEVETTRAVTIEATEVVTDLVDLEEEEVVKSLLTANNSEITLCDRLNLLGQRSASVLHLILSTTVDTSSRCLCLQSVPE